MAKVTLRQVLNKSKRLDSRGNVHARLVLKNITVGGVQMEGHTAISDAICRNFGQFIVESSYKLMCKAAELAADFIAYDEEKMKFHNVTGNLAESIGIAVVGTNTQKDHLTVGRYYAPVRRNTGISAKGIRAKMPGLGKGEVYPYKTYADGTPVGDKPYKGDTNEGKDLWGRTEREKYINEIRNIRVNAKNNLYTLYAFAAMPYATFVNMKKTTQGWFQSYVMQNVLEAFDEVKTSGIY